MRSTEDLVVRPDQARVIFRMAYLSFLSATYALYRGHYDLSLVPFSVGCSTMIYWIHPTYSCRRWMDIAVVTVSLLYQLLRAATADNAIPYFIVKAGAVLCYPVGMYYHWRGNTWNGVYWHCGVHILGNLANIILYKANT